MMDCSPRPNQSGSPLLGYVCVLIASAFWSTSGIFVTMVNQASQPSATALAFWRDLSTFSCLLVYILAICPHKLRVPRGALPWLLGMGVSLGCFHIILNLAYVTNGVGMTTVHQAATPAFVALAARYLWQETLDLPKAAAILLTFAGTFLTTGLTGGDAEVIGTWGFWLGFLVPLLYASWSLFGKKLRMGLDAMVVLVFAFGIASLILLPLQPFVKQPASYKLEALLPFAGLVLISTVGGFVFFMSGLSRIQASVASILAMTEIAFVAGFSYFLLQEQIESTQLIGAALVILGVLLIMRRDMKKA
jgi:drug/metabolite transporter (DMT)-like permease